MTLTYGDIAISINGHKRKTSPGPQYVYFSIVSNLLNNYKIKNQTIPELMGISNLHLSKLAIDTLGTTIYSTASEVLSRMQTINESIFNSSNYENVIDTNNTDDNNYSHTFTLSAMLSFDSATYYDGSDTSKEEVIDIRNYPTLSTCLGFQPYVGPSSYDFLQWFSPPKYTDFSDGTYNVPSNVNKVSFILIGGGGGGSRAYKRTYYKSPYFTNSFNIPYTVNPECGYIGIKTIDVSENDTLTYTIGLAGTSGGNTATASTTYYKKSGGSWTTSNSGIGNNYQSQTGYNNNTNTGGGDTSLIHNSTTTYKVSGGWGIRASFELIDDAPNFALKYYDADGTHQQTGDAARSIDDVHTNMDYIRNSINVVTQYTRYAPYTNYTGNTSIYYSPGSQYASSTTSSNGIPSTTRTSGKGMIVIIPHYSL
uniref:Uncharacterized protein n=1 Tax=viral metagenome TaxID=1070528 RepID=A0A6C0FGP3_9ZZZZ|tara:strand:+ start:4108 stop:5379 length:1272 start_codon:yes stop_codon:yes gene_type:complete